jgi:peptide/nickel transport system ATP-binding protein
VNFDGENLVETSQKRLEQVRGGRIGHIFQNPQGALNPVYTVGTQIIEAIQLHRDVSKQAARERAIDLLDRVGIPEAAARVLRQTGAESHQAQRTSEDSYRA